MIVREFATNPNYKDLESAAEARSIDLHMLYQEYVTSIVKTLVKESDDNRKNLLEETRMVFPEAHPVIVEQLNSVSTLKAFFYRFFS